VIHLIISIPITGLIYGPAAETRSGDSDPPGVISAAGPHGPLPLEKACREVVDQQQIDQSNGMK